VPIIKNQAVNLHTIVLKMWQRAYRNLVVLLLILPINILAQQQMPHYAPYSPHLIKFSTTSSCEQLYKVEKQRTMSGWGGQPFIQHGIEDLPVISVRKMAPLCIINQHYYCEHLGLVCKKEMQFQNITSLPLRLRLGSLEYVDKMEGKH
jgi:hypothetical protein